MLLLLLSCQVLSDFLWPYGLQHSKLPCPYHIPEFSQVHAHWVSDAIQPSPPLLPPSPSAFNLSQHQSLFQWVSCSHQVAKVLELQHQSFQSINAWKIIQKQKKKERESLTQEHLEPAPTGSETLEIRPLWIQGQTRMKSEILTNHCKGFLMAYWLSSPVSLTFNSVLYPHEVEFCTGQSHASQTRDVKYIPSLGSLC